MISDQTEPNDPKNEAIYICLTVVALRRCVMFFLTTTVVQKYNISHRLINLYAMYTYLYGMPWLVSYEKHRKSVCDKCDAGTHHTKCCRCIHCRQGRPEKVTVPISLVHAVAR